MIPHMRQPGDEFGRELRTLRKAHGFGTVALSEAVGRGRNFIGRWERDAMAIPRRDVLLRVIEVLRLTDAERGTLLRLADQRALPDGKPAALQPSIDPDETLLHALLTVGHDWPSEPDRPNPQSERVQPLIDAVAWVLAEIAATIDTDILPPMNIRWPEPLVRLGIVPEPTQAVDLIDIPDAVVNEEMPFVGDMTEPVTREDAKTQSIAMARAYRRVLFSDIDRARALVAHVENWAFDRSQVLSNAVSVQFRSRRVHESHGFIDVTAARVIVVARRSLARRLWTMADALWCCEAEPLDWFSLWSSVFTSTKTLIVYQWGQDVRDSLYAMRSPTWASVVEQTMHEHNLRPGSEQKLQEELYAGELSADSKERLIQNAHRLACIDQTILIKRMRALEVMVMPPDAFTLWNPGDPVPEGHPYYKAGETKLIPKEGITLPTSAATSPDATNPRKAKRATKGKRVKPKAAAKKTRKPKAAVKKASLRTKGNAKAKKRRSK